MNEKATLILSVVAILLGITATGLSYYKVQGPPGQTGPAGATGPMGATGPTGSAGPQGQTGPQGAMGVVLGVVNIPHHIDAAHQNCVECHSTSLQPPMGMPSSHQGRTIDTCTNCHKPITQTTDCKGCHTGQSLGLALSKHTVTQVDVAGELAGSHPGETPNAVTGDEDCIACHAPTATLAVNGMTEAQALGYFFTTTNGKFTNDTTVAHSESWPNVSCTACHDPSNLSATTVSYFESSTDKYVPMSNSSELCGECHGNLRFPDTDHLSYNLESGTGGVGVPNLQTMPGAKCIDCHMVASDISGSNSALFHGHTFAVTVTEADGKNMTSCTSCHPDIDERKADTIISDDKASYVSLDAAAQKDVSAATDAMKGVTNAALKSKLDEAQHNLSYAESDESGGFHNHSYLMSLLKDADGRAIEILSALGTK